MDITETNFKSQIDDIKSAITNASFLTIDCEFSGLNIDSDSYTNPYDSYEQYFNKLKRNVNKFLVLQFGLCAFRYEQKEKKFKQKCYNFYIYPRPTQRYITDQRFICQASSIDFLASYNFDFNKVFREGISYLNQAEETKHRNMLEEKFKEEDDNTNSRSVIPITNKDKSFIDEVMNIIVSFIKSKKDELMLPQCNAFRRRLIYQTAEEQFGSLVVLETRILENKNRVLFVLNPTKKTPTSEKAKYEACLSDLEDAVGFSKIVQFIAESGKLIVGHNLYLDLLHIIDKFLTPLTTYSEFKEVAHCLFPKIIDTKFMASNDVFKDLINNTVLGCMLNILKEEPFEIPQVEVDKNGKGYNIEDTNEHESAYDAFITGICFMTMTKHLLKNDFDNLSNLIQKGNTKFLRPFMNKLFLQKIQDGYINLAGNDAKLKRDHVIHMTFPKDWKLNDITQIFSPFGTIHVAWLNDESAYIALHKHEQTNQALKILSNSPRYTITSYDQYQSKIKSQKRESDPMEQVEKKKQKKNSTNEAGTSSSNSNQVKDESENLATRMTKLFDENSTWN